MISVINDNSYMMIWRKDESFTASQLTNEGEHTLCYQALYFASKYQASQAREILRQIDRSTPKHSCNITLEANALIYFSLREFTSANEFAKAALKENTASLFSYQILARTSVFEKKYPDAIQYYQNILSYDSVSDKTLLNLAETYFLNKDFELAIQFTVKAHSSLRRKLYLFFLSFSSWKTRLLWVVLIALSFVNLYLFFSLFVITTTILLYITFQFGYKAGDLLIFRRSIYVQAIHSIIFFIVFCPTVAYLLKT